MSQRPLRVAIIGAGPAGFYTATELLKSTDPFIQVDMFERLPAPYGLVRHGVAPDHLSIKNVIAKYAALFTSDHIRLFAHVQYGKDLAHEDMKRHYDAIVYTVGAQTDRRMNIPGEELAGSLSATEFVAWYNGHPDYTDLPLDLSCDSAAVIGMGNVALDVARILAKTADELHPSDMAVHAIEALRNSHIKNIYVIGRRGPAQAKWTLPELKEMGHLSHADVFVDQEAMALDEQSKHELLTDKLASKTFAIMQQYAAKAPTGKPRQVHFMFLRSPLALAGENGQVTALKVERNLLQNGKLVRTNEVETLPVGLVLRSVGYKGVALPDVPFDEINGVIPNREGRIWDETNQGFVQGEYVAGWIKRGANGVIGTNKACGYETAQALLQDFRNNPPTTASLPDVEPLLVLRNVDYVTYTDWARIDEYEVTKGAEAGRPRLKLVRRPEFIAIAKQQ